MHRDFVANAVYVVCMCVCMCVCVYVCMHVCIYIYIYIYIYNLMITNVALVLCARRFRVHVSVRRQTVLTDILSWF
jgi:hypothetical protein